ncbi:MAG: 50S ribosomal protein L23 [Pseudomonadota bacterium]
MNKERLLQVILAPLTSEKTVNLADQSNQFVFRVLKNATKPEIAAAIALLFEVDVQAVRTLNVRGKKKRTGQRSDWKKAYVRIKAGQDIKFAEEV